MSNPLCEHLNFLGQSCHGLLVRQHSGRRNFYVCRKNRKHRYLVGSVIKQGVSLEKKQNGRKT